jgi:hypothetical protein
VAPPRKSSFSTILVLLLVLAYPRPAGGFSVLTHEELIDLTWADSIRPLLLKRYPNLTPAQLRDARAFAFAYWGVLGGRCALVPRRSRRHLQAGVSAGDGADGEAAGDADQCAGILLAAGGLRDLLLEVVEEFAGGDHAVVVGVGLALESLQEEVGKDAVAVAPLGVFEGGLADVAGGVTARWSLEA